jgi:hypothetical protein
MTDPANGKAQPPTNATDDRVIALTAELSDQADRLIAAYGMIRDLSIVPGSEGLRGLAYGLESLATQLFIRADDIDKDAKPAIVRAALEPESMPEEKADRTSPALLRETTGPCAPRNPQRVERGAHPTVREIPR